MSADLPQPYRPNILLEALYQRFFSQIQVDQTWMSQVRELAAQGTVVYVLRNLNWVDFFALDHLTKQFGLPEIRFANDLGLWVLNPMGKGWLNAIFPPRDHTPASQPFGGRVSPGALPRCAGTDPLFSHFLQRSLQVRDSQVSPKMGMPQSVDPLHIPA